MPYDTAYDTGRNNVKVNPDVASKNKSNPFKIKGASLCPTLTTAPSSAGNSALS
jgi:hypothetical protein